MWLVMSHRKLRQEANSITLDQQPQKHVLRTVDDAKLELIVSVRITSSHNVEGSQLILPQNQMSTSVQAREWPCRPKSKSALFELYPLCDWQPVQYILHNVGDVIESETCKDHTSCSAYNHLESV